MMMPSGIGIYNDITVLRFKNTQRFPFSKSLGTGGSALNKKDYGQIVSTAHFMAVVLAEGITCRIPYCYYYIHSFINYTFIPTALSSTAAFNR